MEKVNPHTRISGLKAFHIRSQEGVIRYIQRVQSRYSGRGLRLRSLACFPEAGGLR